MTGSQRGRGVVAAGLAPAFGVERDRCHLARSCARVGPRPFASTKRAPCYPSARILRPCSDRDVGARQSRDSPRRFRAVSGGGRGGLEARLSLLDPAWLLAIQVVSGGGGIRTPEGPNGPLRFSRPPHSTALPPLQSGHCGPALQGNADLIRPAVVALRLPR